MSLIQNLDIGRWLRLVQKYKFIRYPVENEKKFRLCCDYISFGCNEIHHYTIGGITKMLNDEELSIVLFGIAYLLISMLDAFQKLRDNDYLLDHLKCICTNIELFNTNEKVHVENVLVATRENNILELFDEVYEVASGSKITLPALKKARFSRTPISRFSANNKFGINHVIDSFFKENPEHSSYKGRRINISNKSVSKLFSKSLAIREGSSDSRILQRQKGDDDYDDMLGPSTIRHVFSVLMKIMKLLRNDEYSDVYCESGFMDKVDVDDSSSDSYLFECHFNRMMSSVTKKVQTVSKSIDAVDEVYQGLLRKNGYQVSTMKQSMNIFRIKQNEVIRDLKADFNYCREYLSKNKYEILPSFVLNLDKFTENI